MPRILRTLGVLFVALVLIFPARTAHADVDSCSASVLPTTVTPGTNANFTVTVTNSSSVTIHFISISVPTGNYFYSDSSISNWVTGNPGDGSGIVLNDGSLAPGQSEDFQLTANTAVSAEPASPWSVQASDDTNGSTLFNCNIDPGTIISGLPPINTASVISNINVLNVSPNIVLITWDSDYDITSMIYYGQSTIYDKWSNHNKTTTTNHAVTLSNLLPGTTYHFIVFGQDDSLNPYNSDDNTFTTLPSPTSIQAKTDTPPIVTIVPLKTNPTEKEPPKVTITTDMQAAFKQTPTISGSATDNEALANIDYSLDGGKNWLQANSTSGLGSKNATFSLTPQNLKDGNYNFIVRATDTSFNSGQTKPQVLIIDRLPPTVGGSVITVGSQILNPNADNVITTLTGIDQKLTFEATGGPTQITLVVTKHSGGTPVQRFNMVQSSDTGLWSGIMNFSQTGLYNVTAQSVDGAGNNTSKPIVTAQVDSAGRVTDDKNININAQITIYNRDRDTNSWQEWDAESFGLENPVAVSSSKGYGFFLPTGTYYLKVTALGQRTIITRSFDVSRLQIVSKTFNTKKNPGFSIGPIRIHLLWPQLVGTISAVNTNKLSLQHPQIGKTLPNFTLKQTDGTLLSTTDFFGKPSVLSFIATWTGNANEQIESLTKVSNNKVRVALIGSGESVSKLDAFSRLLGLNIPIAADAENSLINDLGGSNIPVTYFIDRHGIVKKVMVGVLSKEEILQNLTL